MTFQDRKALRRARYGPSKMELLIAAANDEQRKREINEGIFSERFSTFHSKMIALLQSKDTGTDDDEDTNDDEDTRCYVHKLWSLIFRIIQKDSIGMSDINNLVGYFVRNPNHASSLEKCIKHYVSYRARFDDIFYMLKLHFIKFDNIPEAEVRCQKSKNNYQYAIYCLCIIFKSVFQSK